MTTSLNPALALFLLAAAPALAQIGPPTPSREESMQEGGRGEAPTTSEPPRISGSFKLTGEYNSPGDLDDGGDVSISRVRGDLGVYFRLDETSRIAFNFDTEYNGYDFSDDVAFGPGGNEPWDDVIGHSLQLTYSNRVNDKWTIIAGAGVDSYYETGADFGESLTYAGRLGASYKISETLNLGGMIYVSSRLEDDTLFIPIILVDWKITDQWSLETRGWARGAALSLGYQATDALQILLTGGFEGRDFRLDEDGPTPDGVGRDWRVAAGLMAEWQVHEQVLLTGMLGANLWQELTLDDSNGDEIAETDVDPSLLVGVRVTFTF